MIDGQIEDIRQVAKIVSQVKEQLQARTGIKFDKVSIAAAGRALRTKRVEFEQNIAEMGAVSPNMIRSLEIEAVQSAAAQLAEERGVTTPYYCVGFSVISYTLDGSKILNLESHKGSKAGVELVATFLPNVVVEGLYSVMEMCGLEVDSLTLEPIAAMNAIVPKEIRLINIALVDIGAGTSDIAISKDGSIVAYAMATIAGDEITEEIIKSYFVDFDTAEQIKKTCAGGEDYTYKDIFGIERKITAADFHGKITPNVENLAKTICENILEANGEPPAAVFLVGGGSLITGLAQAVSEKLGLPPERVAMGSQANLKNINVPAPSDFGAEFITPLGIAVTGAMNKGYDFSTITLNDKAIRIFDTNNITVFELLSMAGYKSEQILGRSGRNLTYTVDGVRKTIRGSGFEPAVIKLGGKIVSLNTKVTGGDRVEFTPAVCGTNASVTLRNAVPHVKDLLAVKVNEKLSEWNYEVRNLDKIEIAAESAVPAVKPAPVPKPAAAAKSAAAPKPVAPVPTAALEANALLNKAKREVTVKLNGVAVTLEPNADGSPHTFIELLNHVDLDLDNPQGNYVTMVNGKPSGFSDVLKEGDDVVLEWKE
jgi:cell division ATPase FtsA